MTGFQERKYLKGTALAILALAAAVSQATIISINSGDVLLGNRSSNLVTNGSFEADDGTAMNGSFWATGTILTPQVLLTGWTAVGQMNSYASWGHDGANNWLRGSDFIPHGMDAVYFGAGGMTTSVAPIFHTDGTVTFPSTPTFFPTPNLGPVTLSQTLTGLNTSQAYLLDFWASGELAHFGGFSGDGLFGLDITGENQMYFACPNGSSNLGASQRYYIVFQPNTSSVTLTFTNWGHYTDSGGNLRTELVMDDVIVNTVPESATLLVLAIPLAFVLRRRR